MRITCCFEWILMVMLTCAAAQAGQIELFNAADSGVNPWIWEGARMKPRGKGFMLTGDRKNNGGDSAHLAQHLMYFKQGQVIVDVKQVQNGHFTFQILCFKGDKYLTALNVIRKSQKRGREVFNLEALDIPEETDHVAFKVWVSQGTPRIRLNNIRYVLDAPDAAILFAQSLGTLADCTTENLVARPDSNMALIELLPSQSTGNILYPWKINLEDHMGTLILQTGEIENGTVSLQACIFDRNGTYIQSVSLLEHLSTTGAVDLSKVTWPEQAHSIQFKIWLGGAGNCSAQLKQLLIIAPAGR